ncbi:MAG: signal peptidase I [Coxiellaceae bacterium]|nr:signal peptidase I [Coxiellaceae bacterium]
MMNNFPFILLCLTCISGAIWLVDSLFFAKQRQAKVTDGSSAKLPLIAEYAKSFFPVFLIVLLLRSFIGQLYDVPTGSLEPTVIPGDLIYVNQFAYGLHLPVWGTKILSVSEPKRGDIAVFHYPVNPKIDFVKRVVGLPGDTIDFVDNVLTINGKKVPQSFVKTTTDSAGSSNRWTVDEMQENLLGVKHKVYNCAATSANCPLRTLHNFTHLVVPKGNYFMMGDNRADSDDSRGWGFVPQKYLVGKGEMIVISWDQVTSWLKFWDKVRWKRIGTMI